MADTETATPQRCSRCGTGYAGHTSPSGLCPSCLMALGSSGVHHLEASHLESEEPRGSADTDVAEPGPPDVPARPKQKPARAPLLRRWRLAIPAVAIVVSALAVLTLARTPAGAPPRTAAIRFTLPFPDGARPLDGAQFAPSPDGTVIALAARGADGRSRLWIRRLNALDWRELPRTEGAAYPFWSRDSRHIGFFANRRLERIDIENGLTQTIGDAPDGRGGTWGAEDRIIYAPGASGPLVRISASGGAPQPITALDGGRTELAHLWPRFLADGRRFIYFANAADRRRRGSYLSDSDGERTLIVQRANAAVPVGDVLLFSQNRALTAQRFDTTRARLNDRLDTIAGAGDVDGPIASGPGFSASADTLIYRDPGPRLSRLVWIDRRGEVAGEVGPAADYQTVSLSPDGTRVAVSQVDAGANTSDVWLFDVIRHTSMRLTFGAHQDASPLWSPDSRRLAFVSHRDGRVVLVTTSAAGGGSEQEIATWPFSVELTDWSADGRTLIFTARNPKTGQDVWAMPMTGDGKAVALMQAPFDESQARLSPDGRWIAYVSNESGTDQVHVRSFPRPGSVWQVSVNGGAHPRWQHDGRELLFIAPDGMLTSVAVNRGESFVSGPPRTLLLLRSATDFAVHPGGRLLVPMPDERDTASQLHVIVNWMTELSRPR